MAEKTDIELERFCGCVIFHARVHFVVAEATPDAGKRVQLSELPQARIQRVPFGGDQVSSDKSEIGSQFVGGVHSARQVSGREEITHMDIANLYETQSAEILRKVFKFQIEFPNLEILSRENAGTKNGGGCGAHCGCRGGQPGAALGPKTWLEKSVFEPQGDGNAGQQPAPKNQDSRRYDERIIRWKKTANIGKEPFLADEEKERFTEEQDRVQGSADSKTPHEIDL